MKENLPARHYEIRRGSLFEQLSEPGVRVNRERDNRTHQETPVEGFIGDSFVIEFAPSYDILNNRHAKWLLAGNEEATLYIIDRRSREEIECVPMFYYFIYEPDILEGKDIDVKIATSSEIDWIAERIIHQVNDVYPVNDFILDYFGYADA